MFCEDCNKFETCETMSKIQRLIDEIRRARANVQTNLFQSVEDLREKNEEEKQERTTRRLELRRRQTNCLRRRRWQHYHGYPCFKRKKQEKENRNTENNQNQVLNSYF